MMALAFKVKPDKFLLSCDPPRACQFVTDPASSVELDKK